PYDEEDDVPPETLAELAAAISPEELQLYWQVGVLGRRDLPLAGDQRSGFALILVRMLAFRPGEGTTGEGAPARPPGAAAVRASMARAAAGPAVASAPGPPGEAAGARGGAMAAGPATAARPAPAPAGAPWRPAGPRPPGRRRPRPVRRCRWSRPTGRPSWIGSGWPVRPASWRPTARWPAGAATSCGCCWMRAPRAPPATRRGSPRH